MSTISKNHAIKSGIFYPKDPKLVYRCIVKDYKSFVLNTVFFCLFSAIFIFWLLFDVFESLKLGFVVYLLILTTWFIIINLIIPKKFRFIQINKSTIVTSRGSLSTFFSTWFRTGFSLKGSRFDKIEYLRLDRWINPKKKPKTFGRIEVKYSEEYGFEIFIPVEDMIKLIGILTKQRYQKKPRIVQEKDELVLIFPSSPAYDKFTDQEQEKEFMKE
ncbi:MAG: hypothetical protein ACTSP4_11430 [Candidatus Hodarchaeales archaeon]